MMITTQTIIIITATTINNICSQTESPSQNPELYQKKKRLEKKEKSLKEKRKKKLLIYHIVWNSSMKTQFCDQHQFLFPLKHNLLDLN